MFVPVVRASAGARVRRHGFTWGEVLAVIAVIGILIALAHEYRLPEVRADPSVTPGASGPSGSGATQGRVTVCRWRGDKKAAYTLSVDDGIAEPTPVMAKVFNDNKVKVTWYPVVRDWTDWKLWAEQVKAGHEVGSHTRTHPKLKDCTDAQKMSEIVESKTILEREIRKHVPDYQCLTFCVPLGFADVDEASLEIVRKHYVAAKRAGPRTKGVSSELYALGGGGARTATPLAEYNGWVDEALKTGGWQVETYHGIQGVGNAWESTPLGIFEEHVKYAAGKRDELWIDTVAEIAKYIRERDSVSVEIAADRADELAVNLTDKMDDAVFDVPLTLRILIRSEWTSPLTVTQKGRTTRVELVQEAGRPCAYIEAVPDQGHIVIRPASAAPKSEKRRQS